MKRFLFGLLAMPLISHAGLVFDSTTQKATAGMEDESVTLSYKFKITGDKPVKIEALDVSCGCLEATSEKSLYQPGEKGEVKIVMKLGAFEGEVNKPTTVTTNDPVNPSIQLDSLITIPKIYDFSPLTTVWQIGEAPNPKVVKIKVMGKDPINILKTSCTRENTTAEVKVIKPGFEYEITLSPKTTEKPELGLISLETDCKILKYTKRQIFYTIVKKRAIDPNAK